MIGITINRGFLTITDKNGQVYPGWIGDLPNIPDDLPDVETVYQKCKALGYTPERTIDVLLNVFHLQRIIKAGYLNKIPLVIGLVGGAGGGKSCGMAGIIIYDYLLRNIPVISNMDIEVMVRYKDAYKLFKTESLDRTSVLDIKHLEQMYNNCCLGVDEANIEYTEARRAMSNRNLIFSYVLQERRKRKLDIIHTEQSEMWCDDRLRFATSLYIKTKDAAYKNGTPKPDELGRRSEWKIFDTSGVILGEVSGEKDTRNVVYEGVFHNTPFWHSYNTYQIQGLENEEGESGEIKIKDGAVLGKLKDKYAEGRQVANEVLGRGFTDVEASILWQALGVKDNSTRTRLSKQFAGLHIPKEKIGTKTYYHFDSSGLKE